MVKRFIHILVLCLIGLHAAVAQQRVAYIKVYPPNNSNVERVSEPFRFADTLQFSNELKSRLALVQQEGYLLAYWKAKSVTDSITQVSFYMGEQYNWAQLAKGNVPEQLLSNIGFREKFYTLRPFKISQVGKLYQKIIDQAQDNGYPFAQIKLDSVTIDKNEIAARLDYKPGPFIIFDSIRVDKMLGIKKSWLAAYLGISRGKSFDQGQVDKIGDKIENLDFVKPVNPPRILFENEKATVILDLKKTPSNRIDGIVGFLPNEKVNGGTLVTGQFDMSLSNLLNSGKSLNVHWQSLKPRSQLLKLDYLHRNIFHSPLHLSSSFYLLKEDTTFINRKAELAFHYQPSVHDLSFFTRFESSRTIGQKTATDVNVVELSDFNINYYGANYNYVAVTNLRVPKGFIASFELAVGNKTIRNPSTLPPELLDDIQLKSTQFSMLSSVQWLRPVTKTFGTMIKIQGGKLINDQLFRNDLYRIGGLQTIRGFNENFFFASDYLIATLEMRLHYASDSYIFTFYDQSYLSYKVRQSSYEDMPLGLGVGLSMNTGGGRLNLAYAIGKSKDQPLTISLSKFHFGYVANF